MRSLKSRAAKVDRLQQENESLKMELRQLREDCENARAVPPEDRVVLGNLSPNKQAGKRYASNPTVHSSDEVSIMEAKYSKLFSEAKMLKVKHEDTLEKLHECRTALRTRTDALRRWTSIADAREQTIQQLKSRLKSARARNDDVPSDQAQTQNGATTEGKSPDAVSSKATNSSPSHRRLAPNSLLLGKISAPNTVRSDASDTPSRLEPIDIFGDIADEVALENGTVEVNEEGLLPQLDYSSQTNLITIKVEQSSEGPVFVSAKDVRKRKHGIEGPEDDSARLIKSELSSSSDTRRAVESTKLLSTDSVDFEEEVHIPTPRKRRALAREGADGLNTGSNASRQATAISLKLESPSILARPKEPSNDASSSGAPSEGSPALFGITAPLTRPAGAVPMGKSSGSVLQISSLSHGVMDLAEDGEAYMDSPHTPSIKGRLDALLNKRKFSTTLTPISRASPHQVRNQDSTSFGNDGSSAEIPTSGPSPLADESRMQGTATRKRTGDKSGSFSTNPPSVTRGRGPKRPSILRDDLPRGRSVTRDETRLRDRSIARLRPEDFKPNPKYNDGLTYVYDEVVRGKEARAALSGCTDLKCCGKTFRSFAEAEKKALGSLVSSRSEDIGLMERYLGDQAWTLGTMTREEKEETWLLAKTWELANKFGKHRHRYSRMPTPPGFWNVNFPSTQEREEERKQAEEIRQALVQERYREAMRSGGSWLFRDEQPH